MTSAACLNPKAFFYGGVPFERVQAGIGYMTRQSKMLFRSRIWREALKQAFFLVLITAVLGLSFNALRDHPLSLIAKNDPGVTHSVDEGGIPLIRIDKAEAFLQAKGAIFIDARSKEAYDHGHIKDAWSLPWEDRHDYFPDVMPLIPQDGRVIVYCENRLCDLGRMLAKELLDMGLIHVEVLAGGWAAWLENRLPIEDRTRPGDPSKAEPF